MFGIKTFTIWKLGNIKKLLRCFLLGHKGNFTEHLGLDKTGKIVRNYYKTCDHCGSEIIFFS